MRAPARGPAVLPLGSLLAVFACRGSRLAEVPTTSARHLVMVTIDTLRADRLGWHGSTGASTPNLDRLAQEGALAPQATVHVPLTRPSHASILRGLRPAGHRLRDNVSPPLSRDVPTLAELLKASGFRTTAFVSSIVLSSQSGLGRGFDTTRTVPTSRPFGMAAGAGRILREEEEDR